MERILQIVRRSRGFTLLELLVVVAIMGMLATVAVSGYFAAVEAMTVRGCRDNTASLIHSTQQRAEIDHKSTAVYFYNELLRAGTAEQDVQVRGVAIAVRVAGRISCVKGNYLIDEFGDLEKTYSVISNNMNSSIRQTLTKAAGVIPLYRFDPAGKEITRSTVYNYVMLRWNEIDHLRESCPGTGSSPTNISQYAFEIKDRQGVDWRAGDAYATEIAVLRLPIGYIYGSGSGDIPTSMQNPIKDSPSGAASIFFKTTGSDACKQVSMAACKYGRGGSFGVTSTFKSSSYKTSND